jgi:putative hydrolase
MRKKMNYLIDTHTHTIASGHAYNTIDEMTQQAAHIGLKNIAITDHTPGMPGSCNELYFHNLKVLKRQKYGVNRLFGCEANIIDYNGNIDLPELLLRQMDIVVASFHKPCIRSGSKEQHTQALLGLMKNPYVHIMGHPDDCRYSIDMEAVVLAAYEHHKLLELNNSSLKPDASRVGTKENDLVMLNLCKKYNVCITLGSDAHIEEDIGNFTYAQELLDMVDFPERLIANTDMDLLKSFLAKPE